MPLVPAFHPNFVDPPKPPSRPVTKIIAGVCAVICLTTSYAGAGKSAASGAPQTANALPADGSTGIAVVDVDTETGKVTHVQIERSSGSRRYDVAVIDALEHKQFSPHGAKQVRIPFSINAAGVFTQKDVEQYLSHHGIAANAVIAAPPPHYPLSAIWSIAAGRGRYELSVASTGQVASVKIIQSTGVGRLDTAAINALRSWRFRPGAVKTIIIPMNFDTQTGSYRILLE